MRIMREPGEISTIRGNRRRYLNQSRQGCIMTASAEMIMDKTLFRGGLSIP